MILANTVASKQCYVSESQYQPHGKRYAKGITGIYLSPHSCFENIVVNKIVRERESITAENPMLIMSIRL